LSVNGESLLPLEHKFDNPRPENSLIPPPRFCSLNNLPTAFVKILPIPMSKTMAEVRDDYPAVSMYNEIPFIDEMEHVADTHKDDLDYLKSLLDKHEIPAAVCIKLIHIHFHLNEGEILAFREFSAPPYGMIPFLAPMKPQDNTPVYGCHYLVNDAGDLQAFEYTTAKGEVNLAAYPAFVSEFCKAVTQRGIERKFGLTIKSGAARHGNWIELDYPEKRATFLLPAHIPIPTSEHLMQRTTKTQFFSAKNELGSTSHSHTEHYHNGQREELTEPPVNGVTTKNGLSLTGMPLQPGTAFHNVVSAISLAA